MVRGPAEYVPSVQVKVVSTRTAMPLEHNEETSIRDSISGQVRTAVNPLLPQGSARFPLSKGFFRGMARRTTIEFSC